jgi:hypothetical protein
VDDRLPSNSAASADPLKCHPAINATASANSTAKIIGHGSPCGARFAGLRFAGRLTLLRFAGARLAGFRDFAFRFADFFLPRFFEALAMASSRESKMGVDAAGR